MRFAKENISIVVLFLFHIIGAIGLTTNYQSVFLALTPVHLLISVAILVWANNDYSMSFFRAFLVMYALGFFVEVIGVQTGLLFGDYYYGKVLGIQLFDTPLLIGVNWIILALSTYAVVDFFNFKPFVRLVLSSAIMVMLDVIIEPVAISLDFWQWSNDNIPLQNYMMWFLVSLIMNGIIYFNGLRINYKVGFGLLLSQLIFFTFLSLVL